MENDVQDSGRVIGVVVDARWSVKCPNTFMRVMNQELRSLFIVVYLVDILIYNGNPAVHLDHLRDIFLILCRGKFFAATTKCVFLSDSVYFLGYVVPCDGLRADSGKLAAIESWVHLSSITEVRSFHGLTSFYHCFIPSCGIMTPLTDCMNESKFQWSDDAEAAFVEVKRRLTYAPILVLSDFVISFKLHCNASKLGTGAVLSQCGRPVAYFNENLSGAKLQFSTYDVECNAVVQAVKHWRHYLSHPEFV